MPAGGDVEQLGVPIAPRSIRVVVCVPDEDLRQWLLEELALMTWAGALQLERTATVGGLEDRDLVIVGLDGASDDQLAALRALDGKVPVIAIGASVADCRATRVLGPRLTSRELKQAIRELVFWR